MEVGSYISVQITQQNSSHWMAKDTENQVIDIPKIYLPIELWLKA